MIANVDSSAGIKDACVAWAMQFRSDDIEIRIEDEKYDADFVDYYLSAKIIPVALERASVEIIIVGREIGFSLERWSRLDRGLRCDDDHRSSGVIWKAKDYAGSYVEPGSTGLGRILKMLDTIAAGKVGDEVTTFRGRIVGSTATVELSDQSVKMPRVSNGADVVRFAGIGKKVAVRIFAMAL